METQKPLLNDEAGKEVDVHMYRYLKGQPKLGLWYPKDSPFDLVANTDSDYVGASLDIKSTTGGKAKKSVRFMMETLFGMELELMLFWYTGVAKTINGEVQLHALVDGKKIIFTELTMRRDLQLEDAEDEAIHKGLGDSLVRAATTASSLEAKQDSGNITKTQSKATLNEFSSLGTTSGGGPRCQKTMGDTIAQTRFENVSKIPMIHYSQENEIDSLKRRVKKLERKYRSRTHKLKRLYKVGLTARVESSRDEESLGEDASKQGMRINPIDADEDITLVNVQDDAEMFDVNTLTGDEVFAEQEVATKDVNLTVDEVTLAQALIAFKSVKPKVKGVVIQEPSTTTTKIYLKLQAEFNEEERLPREKYEKEQEANVALTEEWDDIQDKIEADHELAQRLQAEEQEEFSIEEKAKLLQQLLEQRRKYFAAKSAEEKRNKPPTQAQQ
ncbi:hypothetical protein Tco_0241286 [Tanacetum coccineum]